jgi:hypothetical protein
MARTTQELAPRLSRVAVIRDPAVPAGSGGFAAIQTVASLELTPIGVRNADEIEHSVTAFARSENGGVIVVGPTSSVQPHRNLIIALAARHRLPAVYSGTVWSNRLVPLREAFIGFAYRHTTRNGSVVSSLHCMNDPHRRVTWQATPDAETSWPRSRAQQPRGRWRHARSSQRG